jgi:VanZ family protein
MVRRAGLLLALFTLATAVVATQYPFHYNLARAAIVEKWHEVDWQWAHHRRDGSLVIDRDCIQNLLMLMPLGAGFALWRSAGEARWSRVLVEALLIGIATGVALELAQLLTPSRFTQLADAWRNAVGCVAGAAGVLAVAAFARRRGLLAPVVC